MIIAEHLQTLVSLLCLTVASRHEVVRSNVFCFVPKCREEADFVSVLILTLCYGSYVRNRSGNRNTTACKDRCIGHILCQCQKCLRQIVHHSIFTVFFIIVAKCSHQHFDNIKGRIVAGNGFKRLTVKMLCNRKLCDYRCSLSSSFCVSQKRIFNLLVG